MRSGKKTKSGFTLVELSIVLVIVGVLIGGILVGQSLVKTAQIKRLISDIQQHDAVIRLFKDRYRILPGDSTNGAMFGVAVNGNGNGVIDNADSNVGPYWAINEQLTAWQVLSNTGMVEEQYTGTGATVQVGINVPATINGAGINFLMNHPTNFGGTKYDYGFMIGAGGGATDFMGYQMGGFFSSSDIYAIDIKIDDGVASAGKIQVSFACYDYANSPSYYDLSSGSGNSGNTCSLAYYHFLGEY